jgi:hypothetical protein
MYGIISAVYNKERLNDMKKLQIADAIFDAQVSAWEEMRDNNAHDDLREVVCITMAVFSQIQSPNDVALADAWHIIYDRWCDLDNEFLKDEEVSNRYLRPLRVGLSTDTISGLYKLMYRLASECLPQYQYEKLYNAM